MKTKSFELCAMIIFLTLSCFLGIGAESCLLIAGNDYWIVPIIGTIIGFPLILIYLYIFNSNMNINTLNHHIFGNKIGTFINTLLLLFIISLNIIIFWNLTSFVASQYLYDTPSWFITIIFIIPSIYMISKGPRIILRTTFIFFYIYVILFIFSALGLATQLKLNNIMPILQNGITPVFKAIINYVSYMITPIFLILIIPKKEIDDKNLNKKIIITYFISNAIIFLICFFTISVFGIELTKLYQYPSYHILKRVFVGGFIERMENTLSIQWIITLLIPAIFGFYYISKSLIDNFKINKYITYVIIVILMFLSEYIFRNNTVGENFLIYIYPIFILIFLIIIPIIIAIRLKSKKNQF